MRRFNQFSWLFDSFEWCSSKRGFYFKVWSSKKLSYWYLHFLN